MPMLEKTDCDLLRYFKLTVHMHAARCEVQVSSWDSCLVVYLDLGFILKRKKMLHQDNFSLSALQQQQPKLGVCELLFGWFLFVCFFKENKLIRTADGN